MSLIEAAARAFRSLWTPGVFMLIVVTILTTLFCLIAFVTGFSSLAFHLSHNAHDSMMAEAIKWGGSIGSAIVAWMLFPGIMPIIVSFFDDKIADTIEAHDYPTHPRIPAAGFWPEILHDIGFSIKAIGLNIICLPLYLVPGINLVLFYVLNGYLLGREFFVMAARRHMPRAQAEQLRKTHASTVFAGGALLTLLATIPFLNLIAPFWGVALATHLFHQIYEAGTTQRLLIEQR